MKNIEDKSRMEERFFIDLEIEEDLREYSKAALDNNSQLYKKRFSLSAVENYSKKVKLAIRYNMEWQIYFLKVGMTISAAMHSSLSLSQNQ